ncbi:MAG: GIY-YIG nuclease family protein [Parcubacteria group bacterium]
MEQSENIFYVYVLRSQKNRYRYIGHTNDLNRRINEHNLGLTKSIRFQLPFVLEYFETFPTRVEAIRREKFLKSGKGREWLDNNVGKR